MESDLITGNLRMEDIINLDESKAMKLFKNRFKRYKKLVEKIGDEAAFEKMMEKYPEQQKALMGTFIDNNTLAQGFKKASPLLGLMGFVMEVVDISQNGTDAALEIQRVCPVLSIAKEYGFEQPCRVFCEMEQEATKRAFPGIKAVILSKQAEGDCVCVFKYERPANKAIASTTQMQSVFTQLLNRVLSLVGLVPNLINIGIKMLKLRRQN
ncbi:L-2-amino-thiazoline-4-carboxylic acid hydrolase [aff. Roholtiella sp. LEGE 12411]|uniref:L-2-amino-thiazoline-4-carboxylic acid hydrolase n=1 Tax=aff. Roholtiella sp. LEGE 12411 TaxID=1828822 RepID=UPI00187E4087|nr:L-2-amino-thiazoline-4-carboxylic acid hydrolase [aff. Roholtiella sp. LEGE 12411]MBE9037351.1 L-2-amino-thiazoline-4-carboxylic acid hydrolase [aff. Roholtiella sp. LEGE 12411]